MLARCINSLKEEFCFENFREFSGMAEFFRKFSLSEFV